MIDSAASSVCVYKHSRLVESLASNMTYYERSSTPATDLQEKNVALLVSSMVRATRLLSGKMYYNLLIHRNYRLLVP